MVKYSAYKLRFMFNTTWRAELVSSLRALRFSNAQVGTQRKMGCLLHGRACVLGIVYVRSHTRLSLSLSLLVVHRFPHHAPLRISILRFLSLKKRGLSSKVEKKMASSTPIQGRKSVLFLHYLVMGLKTAKHFFVLGLTVNVRIPNTSIILHFVNFDHLRREILRA